MTSDERLAEFKAFGRACLTMMRHRIEAGEQIATMVFALRPSGDVTAMPVNVPTSNARGAILRALAAATEARALLLVSDGWIKDPKNHAKRIGEMLTAVLVTREDQDAGVGFVQKYSRHPFVWEPVEEMDGAIFAYDVFPRPRPH